MPLFDAYRNVKPRFCSEFGFESIPEMKTVRKFASPGQYNLKSPEFEKHQRCNYATRRVLETIAAYFRVPEKFEDSIYITQLLQSLVMKNSVEYWRSLRPRCMGTLYWQINDNWPVLSWASIDYFGNWKQAHYHAKRFFAPVIICAYQLLNREEVEVWAVSDVNEKLDVSVTLGLMEFSGRKIKNMDYKFKLAPLSARKVASLKPGEIAPIPNERFMSLNISAKGKGNSFEHQNEHFFTEYKRCELPDANIKCSIKDAGGVQVITLNTDKPAFFVNMETETQGVFSDNSFTLLPGAEKTVTYEARDGKALKNLKFKHLKETY